MHQLVDYFQSFLEAQSGGNILGTIVLLICLAIFRVATLKGLQNWKWHNQEAKRRWIVMIRNLTMILFIFGMILIWMSELKAFAVSIVAFAVALVIATKELLLCALGSLLKYSGGLFEIGDRIEIGDVRGDVVSHNLFTTVVFEIGPGKPMHQFTGRMVTVPNSNFLVTPVYNETDTGDYTLHVFRIPFCRESDWRGEPAKILAAARLECASYIDQARAQFEKLAHKEGLEIPKLEPRVQLHFPCHKQVDVVVRMPVPARAKGRFEQAVLMRYTDLKLDM